MTFAIRLISRMLSRLPHGALQRLGAALGWVAARVIPIRRREIADALRRSFPEKSDAECKAILRGVYRHLSITAIECLAYTAPGAQDFAAHATIEGVEHLEAVRAEKRGALLLMGHIGNWECLGRVLAANGHPPHVVVRGFRNKAFEAYWREARLRLGTRAINREHSYRTCVRLLRKNEVLAMVLDQNARIQTGVFVDFFGRPACTTPGLAHLSSRTRVPVVPLSVYRDPAGGHHARFHPPLPPPVDQAPETLRSATQQYTRMLEEMIRQNPEQWTWGHRRWRTQPAPATAPGRNGPKESP